MKGKGVYDQLGHQPAPYRKIPVISPGFIQHCKGFLAIKQKIVMNKHCFSCKFFCKELLLRNCGVLIYQRGIMFCYQSNRPITRGGGGVISL